MPTNKKEGMIFTVLMCGLMVLGMSIYNLAIHDALTAGALLGGFPLGFVVAFILDVFVVGVIAKKIAFSLPVPKYKPIYMILTISSFMVLGMVSFMSAYGMIMEGQASVLFSTAYFRAWITNFVVALPYQLLIVGPFSRNLLRKIQNAPVNVSETH